MRIMALVALALLVLVSVRTTVAHPTHTPYSTHTPTQFHSPSPTASLSPTPTARLWIDVLQPHGGETLIVGQTYTIRWNASEAIDEISLSYGFAYDMTDRIAVRVPNTGSCDWNVFTVYGPASNYRIFINGLDNGSEGVDDRSEPFGILDPSQTPTLPLLASSTPTQTPNAAFDWELYV